MMSIENYFDKDVGFGEALRIFDDSMEPLIPEGSYVFTDSQAKVESGDIVFAGSVDCTGTLRTIIRRVIIEKNDLTFARLVPLNPDYKSSCDVMMSHFVFLYKVVGCAPTEYNFYFKLRELTEEEIKLENGTE